MDQESNIIERILTAQHNIDEADSLIRDYFPFIKSETAKVLGRIPVEGKDDELSIALMGFHEAIESYNQEKGAFLSFASLVIKRRIIDFVRRENMHLENQDGEHVSWEDAVKREEEKDMKHNPHDDTVSELVSLKWEIGRFAEDLKHLGITVTEVASNSPKYEKVITGCHRVIKYLVSHPEKMEVMIETGKLPVTEIIQDTSIKKKTLEKHRKYLMALAIIYYKKYDCLIEHLAEVFRIEKGGK